MNNEILKLNITPGKIGMIRYQEKRGEQSSKGSIGTFANKFPLHKNKVLNLRDVEQGLENLLRLPSVIQLNPKGTGGYTQMSEE